VNSGFPRTHGSKVVSRLRTPPEMSLEAWRDAPYTAHGACEWLIRRKVKTVGYDSPPDYCVRTMTFEPQTKLARADNTTHEAFFPVASPWWST
jgi:kynurenine formamidase